MKTAKGYEFSVDFDDGEEVFIAAVSELPGCTAYGETEDEAIGNLEAAVEEWIVMAEKMGWEVPEPGEQVDLEGKMIHPEE